MLVGSGAWRTWGLGPGGLEIRRACKAGVVLGTLGTWRAWWCLEALEALRALPHVGSGPTITDSMEKPDNDKQDHTYALVFEKTH